MFSRFFIDRPIFALVISIVIVIVGVLSHPAPAGREHARHHAADDQGDAPSYPGADAAGRSRRR